MSREIDLTGKRFERLMVVRHADTPSHWLCQCDCGELKVIKGSSLRSGNTRSCGCLVRSNPGRPTEKRPKPFIDYGEFVMEAGKLIEPLALYMQDKGVRIHMNGNWFVGDKKYTAKSPLHAVAKAVLTCVRGLQDNEPPKPKPKR